MHVHIKELYYWKTEHKSANWCQDAYGIDAEQGLFVVTDGAGTTLFPAIWAHILSQHFLELPLMSEDPFEIEWWVRLAQDQYHKKVPDVEVLMDWNARQKALNEGSDSTLAALRITTVTSIAAEAQLLVFGDSCVIVGNPHTQEVKSFILEQPEEFERGPVCIPSELRFFKRGFNNCEIKELELRPDDIVILATDAVSKWILSRGNESYESRWQAFNVVRLRQPDSDWSEFIDICRSKKQMVDDDSTAIVLEFKNDEDRTQDTVALGSTRKHQEEKIAQRKQAFEEAKQSQNKELMAIYYGDGVDLNSVGVSLSDEDFNHVRRVADALREMLRTLQQAKNRPDFLDILRRIWQKHAALLLNEACAANLRETLKNRGILAEPSPIASSLAQPAPLLQPVPQQATPVHVIESHPSESAPASRAMTDDQKAKELESDFLDACADNHDEKIIATYEAIKAAGLQPSDFPRIAKRDERIRHAYQRKEALDKLHKALKDGVVQEILEAYDPDLIPNQRLTGAELEQITSLQNFTKTLASDDDEAILAKWEQIPDRASLSLTPQQKERINLASKRQQALEKFRDTLKGGVSPKRIVEAYSPILDDHTALTQSERDQLALATAFVTAYEQEDDDRLSDADDKIKSSPYKDLFAFTATENERVKLAHHSTKTIVLPVLPAQPVQLTIVAMVNTRAVSLESIKKLAPIHHTYINSLIYHHTRRQISTDRVEKRRQETILKSLHTQLEKKPFYISLLDLLVNDLLIQDDIVEKQNQGVYPANFDTKTELDKIYANLRISLGTNYEATLINHGMSDEDVKAFLQIYARITVFNIYLQNKVSPVKLEDWLEKQRPKVKYGANGELDAKRGIDRLLRLLSG